jgi:hypothetical protein
MASLVISSHCNRLQELLVVELERSNLASAQSLATTAQSFFNSIVRSGCFKSLPDPLQGAAAVIKNSIYDAVLLEASKSPIHFNPLNSQMTPVAVASLAEAEASMHETLSAELKGATSGIAAYVPSKNLAYNETDLLGQLFELAPGIPAITVDALSSESITAQQLEQLTQFLCVVIGISSTGAAHARHIYKFIGGELPGANLVGTSRNALEKSFATTTLDLLRILGIASSSEPHEALKELHEHRALLRVVSEGAIRAVIWHFEALLLEPVEAGVPVVFHAHAHVGTSCRALVEAIPVLSRLEGVRDDIGLLLERVQNQQRYFEKCSLLLLPDEQLVSKIDQLRDQQGFGAHEKVDELIESTLRNRLRSYVQSLCDGINERAASYIYDDKVLELVEFASHALRAASLDPESDDACKLRCVLEGQIVKVLEVYQELLSYPFGTFGENVASAQTVRSLIANIAEIQKQRMLPLFEELRSHKQLWRDPLVLGKAEVLVSYPWKRLQGQLASHPDLVTEVIRATLADVARATSSRRQSAGAPPPEHLAFLVYGIKMLNVPVSSVAPDIARNYSKLLQSLQS